MLTWLARAAAVASATFSGAPQAIDSPLSSPANDGDGKLYFHRERSGWCLRVTRVWIAPEYKGIEYEAITRENFDTPKVRFCDGSVQIGSIEVLRARLQISRGTAMAPWREAADGDEMVNAFDQAMPRARIDDRAGYLFSAAEGFSYDILPREVIATLDAAEAMLGTHADGPFFCGASLSLPMLSGRRCSSATRASFRASTRARTAAQQCVAAPPPWYAAMDRVPSYACRVKGDAPSWVKVLSTAPWWPAGWPARRGPNERGDPRGGALVATEAEACDAFADGAAGAVLVAVAAARARRRGRRGRAIVGGVRGKSV